MAWIKLEGEFVRETEKAYLFCIEGEEHWFPKSQTKERGETHIIVTVWIAEQRGLADYDDDDDDDGDDDTWHPGHPSNYGSN